MTDVTVLGDINVDMITDQINKFPKKDKQITTDSIELQPGGSSFNVALASSGLGLKTRFIGKLGEDPLSDFLLKMSNSADIDTKIKIDPESRSGVTLAINFKNGKRSFITSRGTNRTLNMNDFSLDDIEGEILSLSGFNLLDGLRNDVQTIFAYASKRGIKTSLDPNWDPKGWGNDRLKQLHDILKVTDIFFPDLDEGRMVSKTRIPKFIVKRLLSMGPKIVCLKMGKDGCLIASKEKTFRIPTIKVDPVNTVGAGDIFTASFLKSYLEGNSLYYCGEFASILASVSTTKAGLDRYPKGSDLECWLGNFIGEEWKRNLTRK